MDPSIAATSQDMIRNLNNFVFPLAYLMGSILILVATIKLRNAVRGDDGESMAAAVLCGAAAVATIGFPSLLTKKLAEDMSALESHKTALSEPSSERSAIQAPIAKAAKNGPLAKAEAPPLINPIKLEKLATPEEARASADQQALVEVLLGFAIASAAGIAAWAATRRRRGAKAPSSAQLPEVLFMDGAPRQAAASMPKQASEPELVDGGGDLFDSVGMGILTRPKLASSTE